MAGASVLATGLFAAPALAQQPTTPTGESETTARTNQVTPSPADDQEIVVTGIRASLERAMDIKRESAGVVDAISAEDIGKFPTTNLAESLQRIPGVAIDRRSGEGALVTVRGFGPAFNLVTVNGRQIATSDVFAAGGDTSVDFNRATSRSFDFSNLAAEGVTRLEVYKTGRAAVPSGGIGAAINVVTLRPLDGSQDGLRGSLGVKGLYDTSREFNVTPEVSGLVSWSDLDDTIGISVFGSYQERKAAAASASVNGWTVAPFSSFPGRGPNTVITNAPSDPSQLVSIPDDSRYHYSEFSRERINGQATAQFRPMETLTFTADALFARNDVAEARSDQTNWFNRPFDHVTFDDNDVIATAIFLDEGSLYGTKDMGMEQQYRATRNQLESYGLNASWEVADGFTFSLDGNHSKSSSKPNARNGASSTLVSFGAPVIDFHSVDFSGPTPNQQWTLNDANGNRNGILDAGDLGTQVQRTNAASQSHRIDQIRADLGWDFGGGGRFDVGTTYLDSKMTSAQIQTQQTLGDWGITQVGDVQQFGGNFIEQYCLQCQFDHYTITDAEIDFRGNAVDLYEALAAAYAADGKPLTPGAQPGNPINTTSNRFDQVQEKIWSAYAQFTWKGDFMGREAGFTAGVRYENTKVTSTSLVALPDRIEWDSDNDFTPVISSTVSPVELEGEYNNLLPAIDFHIEPMDEVVARVSYSKTLARADYGNLFASQTANGPPRPTALGGVATGSTGNPNLKPLVSDNFDMSLEWYYGRSSYVSAGFFYKHVKNFVGNGQVVQPLFGLRDPTSGASGTRSGTALARLNALGAVISDVNLFTYTALLVENGGSTAAADAAYAANSTGGSFNQTFVDTVLARTDVIADATDPLFQFSVTTPINTEVANIHGFEIQGQHFFGDTGFGVSGSFTKVYGDVGIDVGADPSANVFALTGLSDTFNITGIYDKNGISARVSYNWRDKFLAGTNRGASRNPTFVDSFGTLDVNVSYDLTENIAFSLEAINVLSEPIRSYARDENQLWYAQELKPRILVGARYRF